MSEVFIVTGSFQHDEESGHWNAGAFTDVRQAQTFMEDVQERLREYLPKYWAFCASIPAGTGWEEASRLRQKAITRLRARVGDANFDGGGVDLSEIVYKIETLTLQ